MDGYLPFAFLIIGVFAGALVSGFAGFAFSAVAGAFLLHVMPPIEAVPLMMACSILVQGVSLVILRNSMRWHGSLVYIMGGTFGIPPAIYLLHHADTWIFRVGFGLFLATYAAYMFFRPEAAYLRDVQSRLRDAAVGFAGGLVGGLTAMPGALPRSGATCRLGERSPARLDPALHRRHAMRGTRAAGAYRRVFASDLGRPRRHLARADRRDRAGHRPVRPGRSDRVPAGHARHPVRRRNGPCVYE